MKGLNKIALASAIAAAPFATQAMEPMNDTQMGDVTGQAGVTIELETEVNLARFEYTQETNGSFLAEGVRIGGWEDGETLDLSIDIDLNDDGDALISLGGYEAAAEQGVRMGFDIDSVGLEGEDGAQATLMSNLNMDLAFAAVDITASTLNLETDARDDAAGHIEIGANFAIENLDVDFDVAAVGIEGLSMAGVGTLETLAGGGSAEDAMLDPTPFRGGDQDADPNGAVVGMTIASGAPLASYEALPANRPDEALVINVDTFAADMYIDSINIGRSDGEITDANSIGSVGMSGLVVSNTRMAIYGR